MELRYCWLQEAWWSMQVIHSSCWVYGNRDENRVKNSGPALAWVKQEGVIVL